MVLNDTVSLPANDDAGEQSRSFSRRVVIDCDAEYAKISVALHEPHGLLESTLRCLSVADVDLGRIEHRRGQGYHVMRWRRPQPGIYELRVSVVASGAATCSAAAFVRSQVRLKFEDVDHALKMGQPIDLPFAILDDGKPLAQVSVSAQSFAPSTSVDLLAREWKSGMHVPESHGLDHLPEAVSRALALRSHLRASTGQDPFKYLRRELHLIHPKLARAKESSFAVRMPTAKTIDGTYNIRIVARGRTLGGCPFVRVGLRSMLVAG
jgi:hypothetical protein